MNNISKYNKTTIARLYSELFIELLVDVSTNILNTMSKQEDTDKVAVKSLSIYLKHISGSLVDSIIDLIHERLFEPVKNWYDVRVRINLEGLSPYLMFSIKYIPEGEKLVISFRMPIYEAVMTGCSVYTVQEYTVVQNEAIHTLKGTGVKLLKEEIVQSMFENEHVMKKVSENPSLSYILDVLKIGTDKHGQGVVVNYFLNMVDKLGENVEDCVELSDHRKDKSYLIRLECMGESGSMFTVDTPDIHLCIPAFKGAFIPPVIMARELFITSFEKLAFSKSSVLEISTIQ